jgi:hypothetical protein
MMQQQNNAGIPSLQNIDAWRRYYLPDFSVYLRHQFSNINYKRAT